MKFEEQQYHGLNRHSLVRRLLLAVFCFVTYYWSENPKPVDVGEIHIGEYPGDVQYGTLFFILGIALVALSVILLFVPHMKTQVSDTEIILHGKFPPRVVRIPLGAVKTVRKIHVHPSIFTRPVFNLLTQGRVRFYTWGNEMIEITSKEGQVYRIGTQKLNEFYTLLKKAGDSSLDS